MTTFAKTAGLEYRLDMSIFGKEDHVSDYDEESLANVLLFEAKVAQDLSRKRTPNFADSAEKIRQGEFFTLTGGSKITPAQIQGFLDQNPGVLVWSKAEKKWVTKVA